MPFKQFCKNCGVFMDDVGVKEVRNLTGNEICGDCGQKAASSMKVIQTRAAKATAAIDRAMFSAISDIEKMLKSITEGDDDKKPAKRSAKK